jgi:magnesium transporter
VGECLEHLRTHPLTERVIYFYVVDEEGVLKGVVPTRRLLGARPDERIDTVMHPSTISVPDSAPLSRALELFIEHRFLALPVTDGDGRLLGAIDVSLFTENLEDLQYGNVSQEIFQLIGVHLATARQGNPFAAFKDRFPWLLANVAGGLLCAAISGMYQILLESVVLLALFIPVCLALAESVSIQSASLTIQALQHKGPNRSSLLRALRQEAAVAVLLGLSCGGIVGATAWVWKGDPLAAIAICSSITLAMITACLLGILLPTAVKAMGKNPTVASGPVVLATADVATLLFYFNLAGWLLGTTAE